MYLIHIFVNKINIFQDFSASINFVLFLWIIGSIVQVINLKHTPNGSDPFKPGLNLGLNQV